MSNAESGRPHQLCVVLMKSASLDSNLREFICKHVTGNLVNNLVDRVYLELAGFIQKEEIEKMIFPSPDSSKKINLSLNPVLAFCDYVSKSDTIVEKYGIQELYDKLENAQELLKKHNQKNLNHLEQLFLMILLMGELESCIASSIKQLSSLFTGSFSLPTNHVIIFRQLLSEMEKSKSLNQLQNPRYIESINIQVHNLIMTHCGNQLIDDESWKPGQLMYLRNMIYQKLNCFSSDKYNKMCGLAQLCGTHKVMRQKSSRTNRIKLNKEFKTEKDLMILCSAGSSNENLNSLNNTFNVNLNNQLNNNLKINSSFHRYINLCGKPLESALQNNEFSENNINYINKQKLEILKNYQNQKGDLQVASHQEISGGYPVVDSSFYATMAKLQQPQIMNNFDLHGSKPKAPFNIFKLGTNFNSLNYPVPININQQINNTFRAPVMSNSNVASNSGSKIINASTPLTFQTKTKKSLHDYTVNAFNPPQVYKNNHVIMQQKEMMTPLSKFLRSNNFCNIKPYKNIPVTPCVKTPVKKPLFNKVSINMINIPPSTENSCTVSATNRNEDEKFAINKICLTLPNNNNTNSTKEDSVNKKPSFNLNIQKTNHIPQSILNKSESVPTLEPYFEQEFDDSKTNTPSLSKNQISYTKSVDLSKLHISSQASKLQEFIIQECLENQFSKAETAKLILSKLNVSAINNPMMSTFNLSPSLDPVLNS